MILFFKISKCKIISEIQFDFFRQVSDISRNKGLLQIVGIILQEKAS